MFCNKCGDPIKEREDPHEHIGDHAICRECILVVVRQANVLGYIDWLDELGDCPKCGLPATHPSGLCRDCHQASLEAEG